MQIDFSLKWKLFILLLVVFFLPFLMMQNDVPPAIVLVVGLILVVMATWYASVRLAGTMRHIRNLHSRLGSSAKMSRKNSGFSDELSALVHAYDHFVTSLEDTLTDQDGVPVYGDNTERDTTTDSSRLFKAALSTGDPVTGTAIILAKKTVDDYDLTARLSGKESLLVFRESVTRSKQELEDLHDAAEVGATERGIIDFQVLLLEDESLTKGVEQCLRDGLSLPESINTTFALIVGTLEASRSSIVTARVADFFDLKQRLLDNIVRILNPGVDEFYQKCKDCVVFMDNVYPTDVVSLHKAGAKGIVSLKGTASSHAEILLQSFDLPSLTNITGMQLYMATDREALLDTLNKTLILDPTPEEVENRAKPTRITYDEVIKGPISLKSGEAFKVLATINNVTIESRRALQAGADGVGLFRSEMSYIGRIDMPTEEELYEEYRVLTDTFPNQVVSMRMLDLGSDKLAIFQQDEEREENPCMGNRSMRLLIRRPDLFRIQLRAMLRASSYNTNIIFPMISGWYELKKVQELVDRTVSDLSSEGFTRIAEDVQYGIMVEIPGVVERFEDYVGAFSFFNIGSNDLTQYALAADRNNRNVADYFSFYHPSVLSMVQRVCRLGAEHHKSVRLCGEMGGDLNLLPLLVGLGVREISTHYYLIGKLKRRLQKLDAGACRTLAGHAMKANCPAGVRAELKAFHESQQGIATSYA